jgi:protein-L-isoaspartate(D-aspartate) O-methyltransferase
MSTLANLDAYQLPRHRMVEQQLYARGIREPRVLAAFERVPREEFIPAGFRADAYEDRPVVIGEGQTISQPYMVASMLEAASISPSDVVLEIGTGSGYQTALLAELAAEVFSIERFATLADRAQSTLARLNYTQIVIVVGDGSAGYPKAAPYDAIVVSAASPRVPEVLIDQLREGGRLVIPVGTLQDQILHVVRNQRGEAFDQPLYGCRFVPLIGEQGFR